MFFVSDMRHRLASAQADNVYLERVCNAHECVLKAVAVLYSTMTAGMLQQVEEARNSVRDEVEYLAASRVVGLHPTRAQEPRCAPCAPRSSTWRRRTRN